jgi:AGCS family alanine or glycine:cation symporter
MYNVTAEDEQSLIVNNLGDTAEINESRPFTQMAVNEVLPGFGSGFVAVSLFFFAFTTIMAYYYIAETNIAYLLKERKGKVPIFILKIVILAATFYGSVKTANMAWALGDIGLGIMVWLNIIAIVMLAKPALLTLKDYERQKKEGKDPVFNPKELGIKNADYWEQEDKEKKTNIS